MKKKSYIHIAGLFVLLQLMAAAPVISQQPGNPIPTDPGVTIGKLPNGFTYYIRKNLEPQKRATLFLVNKVGSILETDEQRGLAHFLEHMAFNGTKKYPKQELLNYLQKSGVRFGADLNAYTGFDETVYKLPVRSDDPEIFRNAMEVLREWAQSLTLDGAEIEKERGVVLEERRGRLGAQQRSMDKMTPVLLKNSKYAERLPIGTEDVLKHFTHETLRQFYKDWYRPDLQAIIVVGDIDVKKVEKMIISMFSDCKMPPKPRERTTYTVPLDGSNQFMAISDPETPVTTIEIHVKRSGEPVKTATDHKNELLKALINEMLMDRFRELSQQDSLPLTSAGAALSPFLGNIHELRFMTDARPGKVEESFKMLWTEALRLRQHGFTEGELRRAKMNMQTRFETVLAEKDKTPSESFVNEYVQHFLNGLPIPGTNWEYNFFKSNIDAITLSEAKALFNSCFTDTNRDIVINTNDKQKASLPSEMAVNQWMQQTGSVAITPFVDKVVEGVLMAEKPAAGKVVEEKKFDKTGITALKLSNGVKILLKPTGFKNDEILIGGISSGGLSLIDDKDFLAGSIMIPVITGSGLGNFSESGLRKYLSGKKVRVMPNINSLGQGFDGGCSPKDLETALQMIYLYFTAPRKDPSAYNRFIANVGLQLESMKNIPEATFMDSISLISHAYHLRSSKPTPEALKAIELDRIMQLYKERFSDASNFTFVLVGNFDVAGIKPLLEQYLGALPVTNKNEKWKNDQNNLVSGYVSRKVYGGKEDKALVSLIFSGDAAKYSLENNIRLGDLQQVIRYRLIERLREEESGIYNVQVNGQLKEIPMPSYDIRVQFSCAPRNVELLILAVHAEIEKIRKEGALQEDLQKLRAGANEFLKKAYRENGFWMVNLLGGVLDPKKPSPDQILILKDLAGRSSAEQIQQAAIDFLNGENFMRFVLLPESMSPVTGSVNKQ